MMYYKMGDREMELKETVTANNLPDSFEAFYHHSHMDNTMKYSFTEIDENTTLYEFECEYTRFKGFMPKFIAVVFPGAYKKPGLKWMAQFKDFIESQ